MSRADSGAGAGAPGGRSSRRRFIQAGLLFSLAASLGWQLWPRRPAPRLSDFVPGALGDAEFDTMTRVFVHLLGDVRKGRIAAEEMDRFLGAAGRDQVPDLSLALTILEVFPGGLGSPTRFSRLPAAEQALVLSAWARSGSGIRRQIHKGLRQAARFVWFGREESWAELGYEGPWVERGD